MERITKELTDNKFQEIYTNKELRNEVAYAHACYSSLDTGCKFLYFKALHYPEEFIVTPEQISVAKKLIENERKVILKRYKNTLLFVGFGMAFAPSTPLFVGNHRIRTEFLNAKGERCFIEICAKVDHEYMYVTHSILRTPDGDSRKDTNNYRQLERSIFSGQRKFTYQNVIDLVNKEFDCHFKEMYLDEYDVGNFDEPICFSPKEE
jgi:hypothetical protein